MDVKIGVDLAINGNYYHLPIEDAIYLYDELGKLFGDNRPKIVINKNTSQTPPKPFDWSMNTTISEHEEGK
jgi:hypothetical protein